MLLSLIRMIQAFRDYQRNVGECPSSAIANWPISASIVRTFRALQPGPTKAESPAA